MSIQNINSANKIPIRPYTVEELANIYGVTSRTVKLWIKPFKNEVGKKIGRLYSYKQIEIIFEKLGRPEK